jgi:hypothetical protein
MTVEARQSALRQLLCELLRRHAAELGLDATTIAAPRPNAVSARDEIGRSIVSIDFGDYGVSR